MYIKINVITQSIQFPPTTNSRIFLYTTLRVIYKYKLETITYLELSFT